MSPRSKPTTSGPPRYQGLWAARRWAPTPGRAPPLSLPVGAHLDPLTILGHLACGRAAELYQVWSTDHWCATTAKIAAASAGAAVPASFVREAEALAGVAHPNVVRFFGAGRVEGRAYLLLEYLAGPSLVELLDSLPRRRLHVPDALRAAMHVGAAVHALHRAGLLYRDLKPGNILLRDGVPALVDFDAVWPRDAGPPSDRLGTAPYMAPEQIRDEPLTPTTDVYGLGAVLFELLTGRWSTEEPTELDDDAGLLAEDRFLKAGTGDDVDAASTYPQLVRDPVPLRAHNPRISREVEAVVLRALARDPRARFQSVSGFLAALAPYLLGIHRLWPEGTVVERRRDTASR